jgi:L,D-transpeptidase catalytic domain
MMQWNMRLLIAALATAILMSGVVSPADAQRPAERPRESVLGRPVGAPTMIVVSLSNQRVTVYDDGSKILQAPVSTGQTGYETPAGIYSVIQKEAEHYSNLYDDASMPFMQRITWSGIALHAGALPGHPASHGCIRMPYSFAERLFELTKVGMRVVIVREDMSPVQISHPALLKPGRIRSDGALVADSGQSEIRQLKAMRQGVPSPTATNGRAPTWHSIALMKASVANAAAVRAEEARKLALKAGGEAARLGKAIRVADSARMRAAAQLKDIARGLEGASEPAATAVIEESMAKALERLSETQRQLYALKSDAQPKIDAAVAAREQVKAEQAAWLAAQNELEVTEMKAAPISVFISRKTRRLYARQAFQPTFENAIAIQNPDLPIGTIVFTALGYTNDDTELRWIALAMYATPTETRAASASAAQLQTGRSVEPTATDTASAKAALERITIPQDVLDRISEFVSPGSSLIISDEELSKETGKDTEFIALMSGEPQGGIKIRRRYSVSDGVYR